MTKPGHRVLTRVAAALVAVSALAGCGLDIDVDHTVAATAPKPLTDRGPAPGTYQPAWRVTAKAAGKARAGYRLAGGNLIVLTKTGLYAYDARTGKPAWHYREPGRRLWGVAETGGAIVVNTFRDKHKDGSDYIAGKHLVGLDAGTGEQLWEREEDWYVTSDGDTGSSTPPDWGDAADGTVVVEPDSPSKRLGIDARTGKQRWAVDDYDLLGNCTGAPDQSAGKAGDGALVLARFRCGAATSESRYVALDAKSGELRWQRPATQARLKLRGDVALYDRTGAPPVLIGPAGKDVYTGAPGASCACELSVTGGHALLSFRQAEPAKDVQVSIDVRTGDERPVRGWTRTGLAQAAAGGRVYALQQNVTDSFTNPLLPAGLTVTDTASGRLQRVPLPYATSFFTDEQPQVRPAVWLAAAGERLLVATQPNRSGSAVPAGPPVLTSYSLAGSKQPVELGGVPAADWPDPCRLLSGLPAILTRTTSEREPGEAVTIGQVRIPRASCTAPAKGGYGGISVRVLWVAATEQAAAELMQGVPEQLNNESTIVRVGRVMVAVAAGPGKLERVSAVGTVTRNLRALG